MSEFPRNSWLEKEIMEVNKEFHIKNNPRNFFKFTFLIAFLLFFLIGHFAFGGVHYYYPEWRVTPDTWICPNPRCGYENYEGINYCALCGAKRR
jgi:hypothetical protein